jgi:hypothetical protein
LSPPLRAPAMSIAGGIDCAPAIAAIPPRTVATHPLIGRRGRGCPSDASGFITGDLRSAMVVSP